MVLVVASPWPLVGRDGVLARIAAAVARPAPSGVLLTGPAGMGRSRLAQECTALGAAAGCACERVLATPSLSGLPLGSLAPLLPPVPPELDQRGDLLSWAVDAVMAGRDRLMLVIDDAHLLDEMSAAVVDRLARLESTFVVMTVRRGAPAPAPVVALQTDGPLERIDVEPLGRADLDALVDAVLGGWVDGITRHDLWEFSGGSPQLLREVVLAALDTGALGSTNGVWRLGDEWAAAPRLIELVMAQLVGLGPEERDLLDLLALAGALEMSTIQRLGLAPELIADLERRDLISAGDGRIELGQPLHARILRARLATIGRTAATRRLAAAGVTVTATAGSPARGFSGVELPSLGETLEDSQAAAAAGYQAAVAGRSCSGQAWFAFLRGQVCLLTGELVMAGGWFREASAVFADLGETAPRQWCLAGRLLAAAQRGDVEEVAAALADLDAVAVPTPEVLRATAWAAVIDGEPALARTQLTEAAKAAERSGAMSVAVAAWHDLARLGDPVPAAAALTRLSGAVDGELPELLAAHAAGLAAGDPVVLGDVADRFEEIGAVLFAAEAAAAASAGHLRRRDRRAVRRLAAHAATLAERCQAATPALLLAGPAGVLTAREHEIVTLAARGLASKAIAGRIGIGVRTVECHLQRAYQKLGVNNRSDLAAAVS